MRGDCAAHVVAMKRTRARDARQRSSERLASVSIATTASAALWAVFSGALASLEGVVHFGQYRRHGASLRVGAAMTTHHIQPSCKPESPDQCWLVQLSLVRPKFIACRLP